MSDDEIEYTCGVCQAALVENELSKSIQCNSCLKWVHVKCSNLDKNQYKVFQQVRASAWFCHPCAAKPQSIVGGNIVLMLNNMLEKLKLDVQSYFKVELGRFNTYLKDELEKEIKSDLMNVIGKELEPLKKDISECANRLEVVENKLAAESSSRETIPSSLATTVTKMDKMLRRADIVIHGIPALVPNAELRQTVINIGARIGVEITSTDVQHCFRLKNKEMVLVKFLSINKRDGLMANYFKRKIKVLVKDICPIYVANPVYLNDSLPKEVLMLKRYCKDLVKEGKLTTVFVRKGDLFIIHVSGKREARRVISKDDVLPNLL